jgi:hypothetical protein
MYLAAHWDDELKHEYDKRQGTPDELDHRPIELKTHSLFVILEHVTDDPEHGWIAKDPIDPSNRLMHFELVSELRHRP